MSSLRMMTVERTIPAFRAARKALTGTVGFVPTMGALHLGHMSLVKEALRHNDHVVASIFVNPKQFGPTEDLDKYPRTFESDSRMLRDLGVSTIFAPNIADMYAPKYCTYVDPVDFASTREGLCRPGFFRGVATVVTKLFNVVQPTNVYFGQKDAVQCAVIRRIVADLNIPTVVNVMPTIREADGLAMSSRNAYLTPLERAKAGVVHRALRAGQEAWERGTREGGGRVPSGAIQEAVERVLRTEPLIENVQYVAVDDRDTMLEMKDVGEEGCCVSLAVKCGSVRLIDNFIFDTFDKKLSDHARR